MRSRRIVIPNPVLNHRYSGCELDWIGLDLDGKIGHFCTAGFGPVPQEAIVNAAIIDEFTKQWATLPSTSEILIHQPLAEWETIGKRGVFVFDWSRSLDSYELAIEPLSPLSISEPYDGTGLNNIKLARLNCRFQEWAN